MEEELNLSRISVRRQSRLSIDSLGDIFNTYYDKYDNRKWRLSYLKSKFVSLHLNKLFNTYTKKVNHGYFTLYLIVQATLSLSHLMVVLITNTHTKDLTQILPDLILYFLIFFLSLLGLLLIDRIIEDYGTIKYLSMCAFVTVFFSNFFIPLYYNNSIKLRPAYSAYLILCCYMLFGIRTFFFTVLLSFVISICDLLILYFITYNNDEFLIEKIISDGICLIYLNILGSYFRYMNDIVVRKSFLDRWDFVRLKHKLKYEQEQTDTLMCSIIPSYVITKVKEQFIEKMSYYRKHKKHLRRSPFDKTLLDQHENLTILFADIVNYTEMTVKLKTTDLIETLHDLFTVFDEAAMELGVTRIKFLGDCYYCVAGLPPNTDENHAEACVDLGLAMIEIIANVRKKRDLNVNMRIGIHTGNVICGIIGDIKYQFDIWSKAVDIANKMESEGEPGKVHITNKTKELLEKTYNITSTNKGNEVPQFRKNNLQTFLISPNSPKETSTNHSNPSATIENGILLNNLRKNSEEMKNEITICDKNTENERTTSKLNYKRRFTNNSRTSKIETKKLITEARRKTAFIDKNLKRYIKLNTTVNQEMEDAVDELDLSKFRQYFSKTKDINIFMLFPRLKDEIEYITQPDPLFKYYLLASLLLIVFIYFVSNITLEAWNWHISNMWPYLVIISFICFILIPLISYQTIWNKHSTGAIKYLYLISEFVTFNFYVRFTIYLFLYALFFTGFIINVPMSNCEERENSNDQLYIKPWQMTHTCVLLVIMNFLFLRMPLWIKLFFASIIISYQSYLIFNEEFYGKDNSFNYSLKPNAAHILFIFSITFTLHTLDRQTDYINRLNHLLIKKAQAEQEEANNVQWVNESLLLNILPAHIALKYLNIDREMEELYYETHKATTVMFASLITDDLQDILDDKGFLNLMNQYITGFDILINREQYRNIEKIKVAKWTYMAACGLYPTLREKGLERHVTKTSLDTLLNFVSDMFKQVNEINGSAQQDCKLRVGICHGSIIAGVVGSKKPLYDIWGDPVNMASRMDSTGVPNKIQVMEETAEAIQKLEYSCQYRGEIFVKGRKELVRTYFVDLDNQYNLVKLSLNE